MVCSRISSFSGGKGLEGNVHTAKQLREWLTENKVGGGAGNALLDTRSLGKSYLMMMMAIEQNIS